MYDVLRGGGTDNDYIVKEQVTSLGFTSKKPRFEILLSFYVAFVVTTETRKGRHIWVLLVSAIFDPRVIVGPPNPATS